MEVIKFYESHRKRETFSTDMDKLSSPPSRLSGSGKVDSWLEFNEFI